MSWFSKDSIDTIDVYDLKAFYLRAIEEKRHGDRVELWVIMADDTPSSGISRYYDRNYDTKHRISYAGKTMFTTDEAVNVMRMAGSPSQLGNSLPLIQATTQRSYINVTTKPTILYKD